MSVADDYDLPPEDGQTPAGTPQQSGSGLRKQLEDALAANKALQARTAKLETEQRTTTLTSLVKGAGLPDAAAARYPADAEVTPEKVTAWAEAEKAYAQQLAGTTPAGAELPAATQPGQPVPPVGITPEAQAAMAAVQAAAAGASPPTEGLEGMYARLHDRSVSWPDLQKELRSMGFKDT